MTDSWLKFEQPVELLENIFVERKSNWRVHLQEEQSQLGMGKQKTWLLHRLLDKNMYGNPKLLSQNLQVV